MWNSGTQEKKESVMFPVWISLSRTSPSCLDWHPMDVFALNTLPEFLISTLIVQPFSLSDRLIMRSAYLQVSINGLQKIANNAMICRVYQRCSPSKSWL
jgi:hypothetical protein